MTVIVIIMILVVYKGIDYPENLMMVNFKNPRISSECTKMYIEELIQKKSRGISHPLQLE